MTKFLKKVVTAPIKIAAGAAVIGAAVTVDAIHEGQQHRRRHRERYNQRPTSSSSSSYSSSSTSSMLEAMPRQGSRDQEDLNTAINLSLQTSASSSTTATAPSNTSRDLSKYSAHTRTYINGLEGKETLKMRVDSLIAELNEKNDALTEEEKEQLSKFECSITYDYMSIPVQLNEKFYDLDSLIILNENPITKDKNPFSKESYNPLEIQSARELIKEFETVFATIKANHASPQAEESSSLVPNSSIS